MQAKNLINAGYQVEVWNRSADKCKPLEELGAKVIHFKALTLFNARLRAQSAQTSGQQIIHPSCIEAFGH